MVLTRQDVLKSRLGYTAPQRQVYSLAGDIRPHLHGYHDSDVFAVKGDYFHSDQNRPGVYAQNWRHADGYGSWQQHGMWVSYPAHFREPVPSLQDKTQKVLLTRKYLLELQARRAIELKAYGTSQSQLMTGNYKASNP